jgi:hypothetical protein
MRKVKARTADLLKAIRENLEKHRQDYAEAFDGYKLEATEALKACQTTLIGALHELGEKVRAADREQGHKPVPLVLSSGLIQFGSLRPPQDHSSSYEVVIRMLEFETQEVIEVDQDQFECYVMDRWDWKDDFAGLHQNYSETLRKSR